MSANDYFVACQIWRTGDPQHGCWEVVNTRTARRAAGPFDTRREAGDKAAELTGAAFLDARRPERIQRRDARAALTVVPPADADDALDALARVAGCAS